MPQSNSGGGASAPGGRAGGLPGRQPDPLKPKPFVNKPMKRALVEAVRTVVDADPPGWTRARLARELHVSPSEMSKLLSGTNPLSRERVEKIATLFQVTEPVRRHLLRAHTAAFVETHPELRERLEKADAYEDAVLHRQETEQRYHRLQAQQQRLNAAHQLLQDRHQATERQLADAEQTAHQERQAHAGTRTERDQARQEAARLRQELEGQQASLQAARREMEQLSEDLASARTERDQARQEAGRLHDELLGVRADLLQHQEEDQRRQDEDAVVAQALQAVEDALHQHHTDAPDHTAGGGGRSRFPAGAQQPEPTAQGRVSSSATSTRSPLLAADPPATTPVPRSRVPLVLGAPAVVLGFVLVVIAQKLLHQAGGTHIWGEVLVGGGIITLLFGFGCFFAYLADSAPGPDDDSTWDAFIGQ